MSERELLLQMHADAVRSNDWEGARDLAALITALDSEPSS